MKTKYNSVMDPFGNTIGSKNYNYYLQMYMLLLYSYAQR